MSWEKVVSPHKRRSSKKGQNSGNGSSQQPEAAVRSFLLTYKTQLCANEEFHDHRKCNKYHPSSDDQRRNPFQQYYSPDTEDQLSDQSLSCLNQTEMMYHPVVYRTTMCRKHPFCEFGKLCAHAHSSEQLRNRHEQSLIYEHFASKPVRPPQLLSSKVEMAAPTRVNYTLLAEKTWQQTEMVPTVSYLALSSSQSFVVRNSDGLFDLIQEAALEECLATVTLVATKNNGTCLKLKGIDPNGVEARILSLLDEPSPFFSSRTLDLGERVIGVLKQQPTSQISSAKNILVEYPSESSLRLTAYQIKGSNAAAAKTDLQQTLGKIQFWIRTENLDNFLVCQSCFENKNTDEGICCGQGHFFCSSESDPDQQCFANLVKSQLIHVHTREDFAILCPVCNDPFESRDVAANLPNKAFQEYNRAVVDVQVSKQVDKLNDGFNERVAAKVEEVLETYGNADVKLRLEAEQLALEARNSVLNLSCPNCERAYFDFSGCMAIQCEACKCNFCAYCHQKTADSRGAHEHVRTCLLNDTATGSYYATPEQIRHAQKMYRTREIKKFLRKHKKNLQNAIVIELGRDLKDLGILPEALFELGNLMD